MDGGTDRDRNRYGIFGRRVLSALENNNDAKILIVGEDSQTGIGKTTLAAKLCKWIDPGWTAKHRAFTNVNQYLNYMSPEVDDGRPPQQSAVLLDELEAGASNRDWMSKENRGLTDAWSMMRAYNVAHIATMPSLRLVDKNLQELADWYVVVLWRGVALPHWVNVNRYNHKLSFQKVPTDENPQFVKFGDLPDDDPDKQYLDRIKDKAIAGAGVETISIAEHEERMEDAIEDAQRAMRNYIVWYMYERFDLTSVELSGTDWVDVSRQQVNNIVNDFDPETDIPSYYSD